MLLAYGVCFILSGSFVFQVLSINRSVCRTVECILTAERVKRNMDIDVNPCDDFYSFACGGGNLEYYDEEEISSSYSLDDIIQMQLGGILENPGEPGEPRAFEMARNFYNVCLRQDLIDKRGVGFIVDMVTKAGGWPVLEGDEWDGSNFDWVDAVYNLHDIGLGGELFSTLVSEDLAKPSKHFVITIFGPSFELPLNDFFEGIENKRVQAYRSYMIDIAQFFGADYNTSVTQLSDTLNFEMEMAKIMPSKKEGQKYEMYGPTNIETMQLRYPIVDWKQYLERMNNATQLESNEVIVVFLPGYLDKLQNLLQKTDKRTLANYIVWAGIRENVKYLTTAMRDRQLKYNQALNGMQEHEPREIECVRITTDMFDLATSAMYVQMFFAQERDKEIADDMVEGIRQEMIKVLQSSDWMDEETREIAIEKAKYMQKHIAYPSELLEDAKIEKFYEKLKLTGDHFFEYILSVNRFNDEYTIRKLREPVNKTDWRTLGVVTNWDVGYDYDENSIKLNAGILQDVFFTNDRPRYMNYGGIGYVIGHEITNGFDDVGSHFDKSGNMVSWWKPKTEEEFKKRKQCFIDQASNYVLDVFDMKLDDFNVQTANIAGNGGMKLSYRAYNSWVAEHGEEPRLVGLEEYSPRQMFWLSAANLYCTVLHEPPMENVITAETEYRINDVFKNQKAFSKDFHCPLGSKMNPVQKCNVW